MQLLQKEGPLLWEQVIVDSTPRQFPLHLAVVNQVELQPYVLAAGICLKEGMFISSVVVLQSGGQVQYL
jgi:hypothetical protein